MKIGILTQPFSTNYGCLLQNYALQEILRRQDFDVWTINRIFRPIPITTKFGSLLKRGFIKYVLSKNIVVRVWPTAKEKIIISQHINRFIKENIRVTEEFHKSNGFFLIKKQGFTAYIVGSDQVWRPKFSPCITNYFLDFVDGNSDVKKIAYAASFGVDDWEFTPQQTKSCAVLAKKIDAISVREDSAVKLCEKYFGVEAIHVLDPTMLLNKEDYINLIEWDNIPERENILFTYILDKSDKKTAIIQKIAEDLSLTPLSVMPSNPFDKKRSKKDLSDCVFSPVSEWIAGFRDAKFVVTDSFHGMVFSIIFNKPFIVIGNERRGIGRFTSLLKLFNLETRLITKNKIEPYLYDLDFSETNKILKKEQTKSMNYLINALND